MLTRTASSHIDFINKYAEGRVFAVGLTKTVRAVEKSPDCLYVQQAQMVDGAWMWVDIAMATSYREATDALCTVHKHLVEQRRIRKGSQ